MHVILEPEIWRQFGLHSKILPQKSNRVLGAQEVGKTKKRDPIPSRFWFPELLFYNNSQKDKYCEDILSYIIKGGL